MLEGDDEEEEEEDEELLPPMALKTLRRSGDGEIEGGRGILVMYGRD